MPASAAAFLSAALLLGQAGCLPLSTVAPAPSAADSVAAREGLSSVLKRYWRDVLPHRPDLALALGQPIEGLGGPSASRDTRLVTMSRRLGADLEEIDPSALSPREYATLQTLRWELDAAAEGVTYRRLDFSMLSPSQSPIRHLLVALDEQPLRTAGDLNRHLYVVDGLAFGLMEVRDALLEREQQGIVASADAVRSYRAFLRELQRLTASGALRVRDARVAAIDTALVRDFRTQEAEGLTWRVATAIDSLGMFLDAYARRARARPGLWQEPGGKEYYRHLLRRSLGVEITPEEAQRVGITEMRRVDSLLAAVRARLGWGGTGQQLHDFLRRDARSQPVSPEVAIARAQFVLGLVHDSLESRVGPLPATLPAFRRATPMEALLFPEGRVRPSEYTDSATQVVVTPAWGATPALAEGRSFVFRWTWPGQALASTVAYARDTLDPVALLLGSEATRQGWAEYAASLAGELGAYGDPLDAYGRLLHEGWNAALLTADAGLHYFGWTRAQALGVLRPYALVTDAQLDSLFVAQVVQAPGRAGAAVLGAREHAAMRSWMQQTVGAGLVQRAWHREVMGLGPVPLPVLASYLEWWGWNQRRVAADSARARAKKR